MERERIEEMIKKLETIRYEWITLSPRLTPQFRANAEHCKGLCVELIDELKGELKGERNENVG